MLCSPLVTTPGMKGWCDHCLHAGRVGSFKLVVGSSGTRLKFLQTMTLMGIMLYWSTLFIFFFCASHPPSPSTPCLHGSWTSPSGGVGLRQWIRRCRARCWLVKRMQIEKGNSILNLLKVGCPALYEQPLYKGTFLTVLEAGLFVLVADKIVGGDIIWLLSNFWRWKRAVWHGATSLWICRWQYLAGPLSTHQINGNAWCWLIRARVLLS